MNAIRRPSGDRVTQRKPNASVVICMRPEPSVFIMKRLPEGFFSSLANRIFPCNGSCTPFNGRRLVSIGCNGSGCGSGFGATAVTSPVESHPTTHALTKQNALIKCSGRARTTDVIQAASNGSERQEISQGNGDGFSLDGDFTNDFRRRFHLPTIIDSEIQNQRSEHQDRGCNEGYVFPEMIVRKTRP